MTDEQITRWFTRAAPMPEKAEALIALQQSFTVLTEAISTATTLEGAKAFSCVSAATLDTARVINRLCPEGTDKAAAIRCLRMARLAANDALLLLQEGHGPDIAEEATILTGYQIALASYNANEAVVGG